jgi:hypothetical protein
MFQPSGPNFLRSSTSALKKHNPQSKRLNTTGFLLSSSSSSLKARKEPLMLFLRPLGGSAVTLIPFYTIVTGNLSLGMVVSQILKALPGSATISSKIASKVGMKLGAK